MKIITKTDLVNFEFWGGAKDNVAMLNFEQIYQITEVLEDIYPDGMTDTKLNDLFWFDFEHVCKLIGLVYDVDNDEILEV